MSSIIKQLWSWHLFRVNTLYVVYFGILGWLPARFWGFGQCQKQCWDYTRPIGKVHQQECLWEAILAPSEVLGLEMRLQKLEDEKKNPKPFCFASIEVPASAVNREMMKLWGRRHWGEREDYQAVLVVAHKSPLKNAKLMQCNSLPSFFCFALLILVLIIQKLSVIFSRHLGKAS